MKGTIIWGKTENLNRTHNLNISVQTINGLDILTNLFTLLITIKTKTELEVILKVILKRILYLVLTLDSSLSYRTFIKQYMYHFKIWSFFFTEKAAIMRSTVVNEVLTNAFKIKMKCLTLYNLTLSLHIMIWGFVLSKLLFSLVFLLNCSSHTDTAPMTAWLQIHSSSVYSLWSHIICLRIRSIKKHNPNFGCSVSQIILDTYSVRHLIMCIYV